MGTSLVVDFYGPIAFRFSVDSVLAYFPPWFLHVCNILTDDDDKSPDLGNIYVLKGPAPGDTTCGDRGAKIIELVWGEDTNGDAPELDQCYCIFQLPPPDKIYGLRGEYASMKDLNGQERGGCNCARGLRFFYSACPVPPQITPTNPVTPNPYGSNNLYDLDATSVSAGPGHYRYEIRFRDLNAVIEPGNIHADADICSATMRKLFPPLDQWTVSFQDPNEPNCAKPLFSRLFSFDPGDGHPVDCGANPLALNDGGLSSAQTIR